MKSAIGIVILVGLLWSGLTMGAGTLYELRVDGLACPFCAYGIEKKLSRTAGVESVEVDLERGLVLVKAKEGARLTERQMRRLIEDTGFTLRGMTERPLE